MYADGHPLGVGAPGATLHFTRKRHVSMYADGFPLGVGAAPLTVVKSAPSFAEGVYAEGKLHRRPRSATPSAVATPRATGATPRGTNAEELRRGLPSA